MLESASWTMDAVALRDVLDRLREALQHPMSVVDSDAHGYDSAALASSLREVLAQFDATDIAATGALSTHGYEYRSESQSQVLRELFVGLREGWRKRVVRILGEQKLAIIDRLLSSPSPDVLRILGREDDENSHSDLIAWLLTPRRAPTIAPAALRRLVRTFPDRDVWHARIDAALTADLISVRREMLMGRELSSTGDLCRVDIVVSGPGFVLALENKVWSREHYDQTTKYWSWLEPMTCLRGGLFVSPSGLSPSNQNFQAVSYLELVSNLLEGPVGAPLQSAEEIVLASYLKTLARYILRVEMRAVVEAARTSAMEEK